MLRNLEDKMPMAPNFRYKEFVRSATALRLGIRNIPNEQQWRSIERVAEHIIQPVREKFGPIRITSGFRSVELCRNVGSSSKSNHTRGEAIDFEPVSSNVKLIEIVKWIHMNLDYREMIAEYFPDGWVHVAYRLNKNIRKLKLKDPTHSYSTITMPDLLRIYK
jgi:zinc D-Ala-D-Ala carboxypeptidase